MALPTLRHFVVGAADARTALAGLASLQGAVEQAARRVVTLADLLPLEDALAELGGALSAEDELSAESKVALVLRLKREAKSAMASSPGGGALANPRSPAVADDVEHTVDTTAPFGYARVFKGELQRKIHSTNFVELVATVEAQTLPSLTQGCRVL